MSSAKQRPIRRGGALGRLHWVALVLVLAAGALRLLALPGPGSHELTALRSAWGWASALLGPAALPADIAAVPLAAIPLWVQLPAATGLALGRVLGLGWPALVLAARGAGLAASAVLCALAVRLAPTGKKILLVSAVLPFVTPILATATTLRPGFGLALLYLAQVLAIAQCPLRLAAGRWLLLAFTGLALVLACPILLPVLAAAAIIPPRRWRGDIWQQARQPAARRAFSAIGRWALGIGIAVALTAAAWILLLRFSAQSLSLEQLALYSSVAPAAPGLAITWQQVVLPAQWLLTLLWCGIADAATLATPGALRPSVRQRWAALGVCALQCLWLWVCCLCTLVHAGAFALCAAAVLPLALWALMPANVLLRRERAWPVSLACGGAILLEVLLLYLPMPLIC